MLTPWTYLEDEMMLGRHVILAGTTASILMASVITGAQQPRATASKDLKIVVVDVEGGAATLFLTPEGKSLLIDTGWPAGFVFPKPKPGQPPPPPQKTSSAQRIEAAAAALGVKRIDYLVMTHFHGDHLGGLQELLQKMPVNTFIDHGPDRQPPRRPANARQSKMAPGTLYREWVADYQGHRHSTVHAGDTLQIGSLHLTFVSSDGKVLRKPLPGAGQANPLCDHVVLKAPTTGEDVASLGMLLTFGKTRILDLGDLTWDRERRLLCPVNKIGKVDVFFVPGHGNDLSNISPEAAFAPQVALLQNGPRKGGDPDVIRQVDRFPDLQGFWRLHANIFHPNTDGNMKYISNPKEFPDHAFPIDLDITQGGDITVTNPRNGFSRTYEAGDARSWQGG